MKPLFLLSDNTYILFSSDYNSGMVNNIMQNLPSSNIEGAATHGGGGEADGDYGNSDKDAMDAQMANEPYPISGVDGQHEEHFRCFTPVGQFLPNFALIDAMTGSILQLIAHFEKSISLQQISILGKLLRDLWMIGLLSTLNRSFGLFAKWRNKFFGVFQPLSTAPPTSAGGDYPSVSNQPIQEPSHHSMQDEEKYRRMLSQHQDENPMKLMRHAFHDNDDGYRQFLQSVSNANQERSGYLTPDQMVEHKERQDPIAMQNMRMQHQQRRH